MIPKMNRVTSQKETTTPMPKAHKPQGEVLTHWCRPTKYSRRIALNIAGLTRLDIIDSLALHLAITPDKLQQQITQGLYNDRSFE